MILENKAQEEAIHTVDGQMLIIACPGSGKTTTLLRRINYMVTEANINPTGILMITFTKASPATPADGSPCRPRSSCRGIRSSTHPNASTRGGRSRGRARP